MNKVAETQNTKARRVFVREMCICPPLNVINKAVSGGETRLSKLIGVSCYVAGQRASASA